MIFLLFGYLVTTLVFDFFIGLAMGDTNLIRKEAETLNIEARAALISKLKKKECCRNFRDS